MMDAPLILRIMTSGPRVRTLSLRYKHCLAARNHLRKAQFCFGYMPAALFLRGRDRKRYPSRHLPTCSAV